MATHHGAAEQPLDRDANQNGKGPEANTPYNYHHEEMNDAENIEQENHTSLATLTQELDDLQYIVQVGEGKPTETLHHI